VDVLAENPYCTVRRVEKRLNVAFTTTQLEKLQHAGILKQVNQASDRVYCAVPLLKILEEPTRLVPPDTA
jgi:hypothetical protein